MEPINILCATDNNYAPYCGIMLTSLFDSNKDCHFVVYIFEDGSVAKENVDKYQRLARKYGNEVVLKTIDENMVKGFPLKDNTYITIPTYYRLLAAELLPDEIDKVIYLDCDIIINGDIKPLWNFNLNGLALAGARDCMPSVDLTCSRLGYPMLYDYINAGVLIYNLDYWRKNGLAEKVVDYINVDAPRLIWMDQDALNGALFDKKILISDCYNYSILFFERNHWEKYFPERQHQYIDDCNNAVIIHYQGCIKPWNMRGYKGPFFYNWEKYRKVSLWRSCNRIKPWYKHFAHRVKRYIYPDFFRSRDAEWIVMPENRSCYKECAI